MLTSSHQQRQQQIQVDNKAPPKGTNGTTEIPSLLLRLVQLLLASKGDVQETQVLASFEYAMRLLNSRLFPSKTQDATHISDMVKKKLMKQDPSSQKALDFSKRFTALSSMSIVSHPWAILYFLYSLSDSAPTDDFMQSTSLQNSLAHMGLEELSLKKSQSHPEKMEVKEVGKGFPFKEMNPMEPFSGGMTPAFNEYYDLGMKGRITEADILRDLLYVFQGIDGRFLKYEARPDAFVLDASVKLPRPTMELVNKLAELGWLYFTIQKNLGTLVAQSTTNTGLVGQSLHSAFKDELVDFYRLIAMLENELFSIKNRPDTFTAIGLSLKRLFVWVLEPLERLRLIHLLMDATKEAKGGAIISTLSKYAEHGDPYIKTFISKLLPKVSRPFFDMLFTWIRHGQLQDPFHEFCIMENSNYSDLWRSKYAIRMDLVPSFLSKALVQKIAIIGKSINFLQYECNETFVMPMSIQSLNQDDFHFDNLDRMQCYIDTVYEKMSGDVLGIFLKKYQLIGHLEALKKYLLLGQGDFIQCLMDSLSPNLSKDANVIYRHNLTGSLESALRASNAELDDPDIFSRLDVRLLEVSPGDSGWEVFSLDYHVDGPLKTVFNKQAMHAYHRLFTFLWRLKRVEHVITLTWKQRIDCSHLRMDCQSLVHKYRLLWTEMTHFIYQLQYYILFEVLEASWKELMVFMHYETKKDLDQLIHAHSQYLNHVAEKCFLVAVDGSDVPLAQKMRTLFQIVLEFQKSHEQMGHFIDKIQGKQNDSVAAEYALRLMYGQSGLLPGHQVKPEETSMEGMKSALEAISIVFHDEMKEFVDALNEHKDPNVRLLAHRFVHSE